MSSDHSGKTTLESATTLGMEQLPDLVNANGELITTQGIETDQEPSTSLERMIPHFASADDRYQLVQMLGERYLLASIQGGGQKAGWYLCDESVALRVKAQRSNLPSLLNEAKLIFHLSHPCIISVYDIGQLQSGQLYFTMQEVRGDCCTLTLASATSMRPLMSG